MSLNCYALLVLISAFYNFTLVSLVVDHRKNLFRYLAVTCASIVMQKVSKNCFDFIKNRIYAHSFPTEKDSIAELQINQEKLDIDTLEVAFSSLKALQCLALTPFKIYCSCNALCLVSVFRSQPYDDFGPKYDSINVKNKSTSSCISVLLFSSPGKPHASPCRKSLFKVFPFPFPT